MPYEYYLVPASGETTFPDDLVNHMHTYVQAWPVYRWDDTYLVFRSDEDRARRLPSLLAHPERNDYLTATISIADKEVSISSVLEDETDRLFYTFVQWCQAQWPAALYSSGPNPIPAEDLLERA